MAIDDKINRRKFIKQSALATSGLALSGCLIPPFSLKEKSIFKISLAEWSLHRSIFGAGLDKSNWRIWEAALKTDPRSVLQGEVDHLDFAVKARQVYGLDAVEYVNVFFFDRAQDISYLNEMRTRAQGEGVKNLLIMCDHEGKLGDPDPKQRRAAVENHFKWVQAASHLGCHSIRVNASSSGNYSEQQKLAADGLRQLAEFGEENEINILVENHGGLSSNGKWLRGVMQLVDHPRIGTLPDFGNFQISSDESYDNYLGIEELMPFAKGVSAKALDFTAEGQESNLDYIRLLQIVHQAGFSGYVGIEYEGDQLSEHEGILATKELLENTRKVLIKQEH